LRAKIETVRVHIGDDDVTRGGVFAIGMAMQPMGPGAGDQHIFADEIERQRGVNGIA